jgi:glycosyltransferase involved in cell wall biosynthesis
MALPKMLALMKWSWPEGGGAELATDIVLRDILSNRFDITILSGTREPDADLARTCRYLYWSSLTENYKPVEWCRLLANSKVLHRLINDSEVLYIPSHTLLPVALAVRQLAPKTRIILHLHNFQPLAYGSVLFPNESTKRFHDVGRSVRLEVLEHDDPIAAVAAGLVSPLNFINGLSLYSADRVIAVSFSQAKILRLAFPGVANRIAVCYNPIPNIRVLKNVQDRFLVYIGGGLFSKGFQVVMELMARRAEPGVSPFALNIAGPALNARRLEMLALLSRRGRNDVTVLGKVSHNTVLSLYSKAIGSLCPSVISEPLPYAVIESLLTGTVPLASWAGAIPEIVGQTELAKFTFPIGDARILGERVDALIGLSRESLASLGEGGRSRVLELFEESRVANNLLRAFEAT